MKSFIIAKSDFSRQDIWEGIVEEFGGNINEIEFIDIEFNNNVNVNVDGDTIEIRAS